MKIIFRTFTGLFLILLLLTGLCTWLLFTNAGSNFAVKRLVIFSGANISFDTLQGSLAKGLSVTNLQYQSPELVLNADKLFVQLKLPLLLSQKRLFIDTLTVAKLQLNLLNSADKTQAPASEKSFSSPIRITVNTVKITNINIKKTDKNVLALDSLTFSGDINRDQLSCNLNAVQAQNQLNLKAMLKKPAYKINWQANFPNLNSVTPLAQGQLYTQGEIVGGDTMHYIGDIKIINVKFQQISVRNLNGNFSLPHNYGKNSLLNLQVTDLAIAKDRFQTIALNANGDITQHNLMAKMNSSTYGRVSLQAQGALTLKDHPGWSGKITQLTYVTKQQQNLRLTNPFNLQANAQQATVNNMCLAEKTSQACLDMAWKKTQSLKLNAQLKNFNSDLLLPFYPQLLGLQAKLSLDTALQFDFVKNATYVKGDIIIPQADIIYNPDNSMVLLPPETTIVGISKKQDLSGDTYLNLKVQLGDQVKVAVQGLSGNLSGQLKVKSFGQGEPIGNGQLTLKNGSFNFRGTILQVKHAALNFINSRLSNPIIALDAVRATDQTDKITQKKIKVGVNASGTLDHPVITLFSDPAGFSQEDILAYLMFGQDLSSLSNSKFSMMMQAMSFMSGGKQNGLTQLQEQLKNTFGLNDLGVKNNGTDIKSGSLFLGKYLAPKLYIKYNLGLTPAANNLTVQYFIAKHFSIQSQTGFGNAGVDIFYHAQK